MKMKVTLAVLLATFTATQAGWTAAGKTDFIIFETGLYSETGAFAVALQNGQAAGIKQTTDLGATWTDVAANKLGLLLLSCAALGPKRAIVATVIGEGHYTLDGGKSWKTSLGLVAPGGQDIRVSRDGKFYGAVGSKGPSISHNFGIHFEHLPIGNGYNLTRYGAFVNENTWYMTGGKWPSKNSTNGLSSGDTLIKPITSRVSLKSTASGEVKYHHHPVKPATTASDPIAYQADIWKTTDGGQNWTRQYHSINEFYFNGIDCCSETVCYAVGEGYDDGSSSPGSRIWKTSDGETWASVYTHTADKPSLTQVACLGSGDEAWAAGGHMERPGFEGTFQHTTDGGKTWNLDYSNREASVIYMDFMNDGKAAIASGTTVAGQGAVYSFTASGTDEEVMESTTPRTSSYQKRE